MPDNTGISLIVLMITIVAAAGGLATLILTGLESINARITETSTTTNARITDLAGRLDRMDTRFDRMDTRFDRMDARLDRMDARLDSLDARMRTIEIGTAELRAYLLPRSNELPQPSPGSD